jgi:hypothetical protein
MPGRWAPVLDRACRLWKEKLMLKRSLLFGLSAVVVGVMPNCVRGQADPYDAKTISADPTIHRPVPV